LGWRYESNDGNERLISDGGFWRRANQPEILSSRVALTRISFRGSRVEMKVLSTRHHRSCGYRSHPARSENDAAQI